AHGGRLGAGAGRAHRTHVPVAPPLGRGGSAGFTVPAPALPPGPSQPVRRGGRAGAAPDAPAARGGAAHGGGRRGGGSRRRPQDAVELRVLGVGGRRLLAIRRGDGVARVVVVRGGAVGRVRPAADVHEALEGGLLGGRRAGAASLA